METKRKKDTTVVHEQKKKIMTCKCTSLSISHVYKHEGFSGTVKDSFSKMENKTLSDGPIVITKPFRCCVLPNFLSSGEFLNHLKDELKDLEMEPVENDLYQFKQSEDLSASYSAHIKILRNLLYGEGLSLISDIMEIPLTDKVDMTCAVYEHTDFLLCHDDQLEGRSVAFIFYLCSNWGREDGGTLDLFNSEQGSPTIISESIIPGWNKFAFFEVSPLSFHQVAEVLKEKKRLSISGWFHGLPRKKTLLHKECCLLPEPRQLYSPVKFNGDLTSWVNPDYLKANIQIQIQESFSQHSQIQLPNFFLENKYLEVCAALKNHELSWSLVGPPNKRCYEEGLSFPPVIKECLQLLHSDAICIILSNLTGLALHDMAVIDSSDESENESDSEKNLPADEHFNASSSTVLQKRQTPKEHKKAQLAEYTSVMRKWKNGYYTLLHDHAVFEASLDTILYFSCEGWEEECGGYISYVAVDDGNELLRVEPQSNTLALAYVDTDTRQFVKYINCKGLKKLQNLAFYDIFTSYFERMIKNE